MVLASESLVFLLKAVLVLFVIAPLFGALFLKVAFRLVKREALTFLRCWAAYATAYVTASVGGTLLLLLVPNTRAIPNGLMLLLSILILAVHFALIPLVLQKGFRQSICAQALALAMYAILLGILFTPVMLHAQKQSRRIQFIADLKGLARTLSDHAREHNERLPATLGEAEDAVGYPIHDLSPKEIAAITYIGEYVQSLAAKTGSADRMDRLFLDPFELATDPLLWSRSPDFKNDEIVVVCVDTHYEIMSESELKERLQDAAIRLGLPPTSVREHMITEDSESYPSESPPSTRN